MDAKKCQMYEMEEEITDKKFKSFTEFRADGRSCNQMDESALAPEGSKELDSSWTEESGIAVENERTFIRPSDLSNKDSQELNNDSKHDNPEVVLDTVSSHLDKSIVGHEDKTKDNLVAISTSPAKKQVTEVFFSMPESKESMTSEIQETIGEKNQERNTEAPEKDSSSQEELAEDIEEEEAGPKGNTEQEVVSEFDASLDFNKQLNVNMISTDTPFKFNLSDFQVGVFV